MLLIDTNILIDLLRGDAIALESERLRQRQGLKIPKAINLATARCAALNLATRNSRDFSLTLGGVPHPYQL
jgi:predicted nucleic acid-binding protein